nr:MAG TPA: hypothetical protein [Caudoviricetes sp.]
MTCFTPSDARGAPKVKLRKALARAAGIIASLRFGVSKSEGVTFSFLNQKRPYLLAGFLRPANSTPTRSSVNFLTMPSFPAYLPPYSSLRLMLTIVSMPIIFFSPFKYQCLLLVDPVGFSLFVLSLLDANHAVRTLFEISIQINDLAIRKNKLEIADGIEVAIFLIGQKLFDDDLELLVRREVRKRDRIHLVDKASTEAVSERNIRAFFVDELNTVDIRVSDHTVLGDILKQAAHALALEVLDRIVFTEFDLGPNIRIVLDGSKALAVDKAVQNALGELNTHTGMAIALQRPISSEGALVARNAIIPVVLILGAFALFLRSKSNFTSRPIAFIIRKGKYPLNILVGMAIPFGGGIHLFAVEQIPVLIHVMISIGALGSIDTNDEPASAKGSLAVRMLVGFPSKRRKSVHQGCEENEPLMIEGIESVEPVGEFSNILLRHRHCTIIPIFIGEYLPAVSPKCFDDFGKILIDRIEMDALRLTKCKRFFQRFANSIRPKNDLGASGLFVLNLGDIFFNRRTDLRPFVFNQSAIEVDSNNFCVIHDFSFSCYAAFGIGAVDHPTKRPSLKFFFSLSALLIARSMPEKLFRWK